MQNLQDVLTEQQNFVFGIMTCIIQIVFLSPCNISELWDKKGNVLTKNYRYWLFPGNVFYVLRHVKYSFFARKRRQRKHSLSPHLRGKATYII